MKKLIEIQSLIMKLEELMNLQYKSSFDFKDNKTVIIETYCRDHRKLIEGMTEHLKDCVSYTVGNCKIELIQLTEE